MGPNAGEVELRVAHRAAHGAERRPTRGSSEYADRPQLFPLYDPRYPDERAPGFEYDGRPNGVTPGLADTYYGQCRSRSGAVGPVGTTTAPSAQPFTPCRNAGDAGVIDAERRRSDTDAAIDGAVADAGDAGAGDARTRARRTAVIRTPVSADAGGADDGGVPDAAPTDPPFTGECLNLDDIDVALRGLHPQDVWVTRLRASLPANRSRKATSCSRPRSSRRR